MIILCIAKASNFVRGFFIYADSINFCTFAKRNAGTENQ